MLTNQIQVEFMPGMQGCFKIFKLVNKIYNVNKLCDHINRYRKSIYKVQHLFFMKILGILKAQRTFSTSKRTSTKILGG